MLGMLAAFNLCAKVILIPKLSHIGQTSDSSSMIESYIIGKKNACKVQGSYSEYQSVRDEDWNMRGISFWSLDFHSLYHGDSNGGID